MGNGELGKEAAVMEVARGHLGLSAHGAAMLSAFTSCSCTCTPFAAPVAAAWGFRPPCTPIRISTGLYGG